MQNFSYTNSTWGDLLTNYDGTTISYDASGNPKNWKDILILDWRGNRLKNLYFDTPDAEGIFFEYNADGIRTEKTYAERAGEVPVYTDVYTVDGSKILSEQRTDEETGNVIRTIYYVYDANGQPVGMKYNGVQYWYQKNMQGDVVRILNASGAEVVSYAYDAWGKVLSVSGSLSSTVGAANPFRYRGYYYDTETGWYYLNSRYYDPNVGRFLSPDNANLLLASPRALTDKNLYAYCDNNPVMRTDDNGDFWHIAVGGLLGGLIGGIAQVASNIIEGENAFDGVGAAFISGAASGALASTGVGIVGSIVGNAGISMAENVVTQVIDNNGFDDFDVGDMLIDGAIGGISGAIGGGGSGSKHLNKLGKQTIKRTLNTTVNKGVKEGIKELGRAFSYYAKNTRAYYIALKNGIWKDVAIETTISIASSDFMKYQYRKILDR